MQLKNPVGVVKQKAILNHWIDFGIPSIPGAVTDKQILEVPQVPDLRWFDQEEYSFL